MLQLKDLRFEVDRQNSEFFAYVPQSHPDQLYWSLEIRTEEKEYERDFVPLYLETQGMLIPISDWRMADGQEVSAELDFPLGAFLYLLVHSPTRQNVIRFSHRRGESFAIEWQCLADVFWDEDYSSNLALSLETRLPFDGVHIWWMKAEPQSLAQATALVSRHLDLRCLKEPEFPGPYHIRFPPAL